MAKQSLKASLGPSETVIVAHCNCVSSWPALNAAGMSHPTVCVPQQSITIKGDIKGSTI